MNASVGKIRLSVALCGVIAAGCAVYGIVDVRSSAEQGWSAAEDQKKDALRGTVRSSIELYAERDSAGEISRMDRPPQVAEKGVAPDAAEVLPKGMNAAKLHAMQERMNSLYASQNVPNEIMSLGKSAPGVAVGAGESK